MLDSAWWGFAKPIAHRGLHGAAGPENSLAAFEAAIAAGYPIELDVRLNADGAVYVFHDDDVARMTGRPGLVSELGGAEIAALRLAGSDERIPTFADVLDCVRGRTPLLIEIKNEGDVGALEQAVMSALEAYKGDYAIQSFNPFSVGWVAKHYPDVIRGQLSSDFRNEEDMSAIKKVVLSNMWLNAVSKPAFIAYDVRALDDKKIEAMKKRAHGRLIAWTIDDEAKRALCKQAGVNFIFEGVKPE